MAKNKEIKSAISHFKMDPAIEQDFKITYSAYSHTNKGKAISVIARYIMDTIGYSSRGRENVVIDGFEFSSKKTAYLISYHKLDYRCYICGMMRDLKVRKHADHNYSYEEGGYSGFGNLYPTCEECNIDKGKKSIEDYRKIQLERIKNSNSGNKLSEDEINEKIELYKELDAIISEIQEECNFKPLPIGTYEKLKERLTLAVDRELKECLEAIRANGSL